MKANDTLLQRKYARIIEAFSQNQGISLNDAMDVQILNNFNEYLTIPTVNYSLKFSFSR